MSKNNENNGLSFDDAVIINNASTHFEGIDAEYNFISKKYGNREVDWKLKKQTLIEQAGRFFDQIEIILKNGLEISLYFDITEFFGKGL
jgi:hypothetical protein